LNITVTSGAGKGAAKPKGKARAEGLEILSNANLKLKAGVHYALIGRNGTGKSSELSFHLWPQLTTGWDQMWLSVTENAILSKLTTF
jgi:ABC-type transport system involved in cytochrome bd biosynthesis fused ATPase/permease subunit